MNKFKKINSATTIIILILFVMIVVSWMTNQASQLKLLLPRESLDSIKSIINSIVGRGVQPLMLYKLLIIQVTSFLMLILASIWILIKLNQMRQSVAFDNTTKSGTIHLRTQILTVITIAVLVFGTFAIFRINPKEDRFAFALSICAGIIAIAFPEIIKSITAYTNMATNHHLHVGDWISIPKHGVDGKVKSVSMMSITIENWDNSISTIPTHLLQTEHLVNYQRILDINGFGRRMCKTFVIDSSSIHTMNREEVAILSKRLKDLSQKLSAIENVTCPTLNLQLYRLFIHYWLQNNEEIMAKPRLLASLQEPTPEGVPLQIYVFLKRSGKEDFEKVQSLLTEFILMSMEWFGLRLYQRPSDYQIARLGNNTTAQHEIN